MDIKNQIKVLEYAKNYVPNVIYGGLCYTITFSLSEHFHRPRHGFDGKIRYYIPSFSRWAVFKLCLKHHIKLPSLYKAYWWEIDQYDTRILVLTTMIDELKLKL